MCVRVQGFPKQANIFRQRDHLSRHIGNLAQFLDPLRHADHAVGIDHLGAVVVQHPRQLVALIQSIE